MSWVKIIQGDILDVDLDEVDLVFGSPPYEDARTYGIDFRLRGNDWVSWAYERYRYCLRHCRGLVAWVVQGRTRDYCWSAVPAKLLVELADAIGVAVRNPPIFQRSGIPGSGGPDWLRSDYEWIICATRNGGRLPWSDNTVMGHTPKYGPGGPPSHRTTGTRGYHDGDARVQNAVYKPPARANPGNVISGTVGGGAMGSPLAHETEAPFPEWLAEFFVRSFCPPGGVVLDPFSGSGTTAKVAAVHGRNAIAVDIRESQCELTKQRIKEETNAEIRT